MRIPGEVYFILRQTDYKVYIYEAGLRQLLSPWHPQAHVDSVDVLVCVRVCVARACVRACVCVCVRAMVAVHHEALHCDVLVSGGLSERES